ncbi:uncharacterized abhydrolase domain-containing protein DDB_G0269086-like [Dendronephthya gigantea]|uniref:uncharacterized abhydrolase domain-containing protein DDB_G0269086-like n=1 Tax=Dendronephthya gigantea TaxID=151771 RepID=UPI00106C538C|nr:uncharacterized abhydrolase domain-containing protein DDB_G0269086-like [Dendronephthya gigantea]XP_028418617.1 uncharacterized abhydrolase domain-containing protein DDB_G0269086-like [Dendronephthya gigantea]XP_028418957.1 uncharacterized abhydrolase domain-containing protein DDB_G0269086-like [Dendronephthya gigantea]
MTKSTVPLEGKEGFKSGVCFIMKWTTQHDVEFCKEVVASKLFETKKRSAERALVWESIAKNLEKIEYPKFKVEQRSVRDRLKKLMKQFRKKENEERRASGISPELTELDTLLEEICEREHASETLAAEMGEKEKRRLEEDQMAAQEIRKRAMETLSETQVRNAAGKDQHAPKCKIRKGADTALAFLAEKAEKERELKEESNKLERERLEMEKEKTEKFMQQQNDMLNSILEMQRQQNNQVQASQMVLMQQQQQQGQALIALLSKIIDKEN